jgi:hypothetical protein
MLCNNCPHESPQNCEDCATALLNTEELRAHIEEGLRAGFKRPDVVAKTKIENHKRQLRFEEQMVLRPYIC